jgi:hypothetical protein
MAKFNAHHSFELNSSDMDIMIDLNAPIHICIMKCDSSTSNVLGTAEVDWRTVLQESDVSVEIRDISNPNMNVAIIDLKLKLLTNREVFLARDQIRFHVIWD